MKLKFSLSLLSAILWGNLVSAQSVNSPDGRIVFHLETNDGLHYSVKRDGKTVIETSRIAISLGDGKRVGFSTMVEAENVEQLDESWKPVVNGRFSIIHNRCNERIFHCVENGPDRVKFDLVVRVFDEGAAFRILWPKQKTLNQFRIMEELLEFRLPEDNQAWVINHKKFGSGQESFYNKHPIREVPVEGLYGLPLLAQNEDTTVAITEAALVSYGAMFFEKTGANIFRTRLARRDAETLPVVGQLPHSSPWRVIMIAGEPVKLLENTMLLNLNEPCEIEDPSWIEPGMMAWDHWWSGNVKMDTETILSYIDLAAEMGWEYQLIDWQWYGPFNRDSADITTVNPAVDMKQVRNYAADKGVKLWLWLHSNDVDRNDAYLDAFPLYQSWGIAGVKIDFMDRADQEMVNWYHKIVKYAARHHLMVNFHGAYAPTGWRRTYPNLLTREGVFGNEHNRGGSKTTPSHKCALAFTRNLLGEMDFTPGGFLNRTPETFEVRARPTQVIGTRAQELALFVVYESPLTCVCERPENILGQDGADFLKIVPTVWDETVGLIGEIGEYIAVAKRSGDQWYLGAINNEIARSIEIPLTFLETGNWKATFWKDGDEGPESILKENATVSGGQSLSIPIRDSGGMVAVFERM